MGWLINPSHRNKIKRTISSRADGEGPHMMWVTASLPGVRRRRQVRKKFNEHNVNKDGILTKGRLVTALCGVAAEGLYRFNVTLSLIQKYRDRTASFEEFERICKQEHNGSEWLESSDSDGEV